MSILRNQNLFPLKAALTAEDMNKALSRTPRTARYRRPIDQSLLKQLRSQIQTPPEENLLLQDQSAHLPDASPEKTSRVKQSKKRIAPKRASKSPHVPVTTTTTTTTEYDPFFETGEVTGYTPKPLRPGPKRKKRLVKAPNELQLNRRLPPAIQKNAEDESDVISTTETFLTEETGYTENANLHTLTQFGHLLKKCWSLVQEEKKVRGPNDASLSWIDEDLLLARTIKREISMDGEDGKYLTLTKNVPTPVAERDVPAPPPIIVNEPPELRSKQQNANLAEKLHKIKAVIDSKRRPGKLGLDGFDIEPPQQNPTKLRKPKVSKFPTKKNFFDSTSSTEQKRAEPTLGINKVNQKPLNPSDRVDADNIEDDDEMLLSISQPVVVPSLTSRPRPQAPVKTIGDFITARKYSIGESEPLSTPLATVPSRRKNTSWKDTSITKLQTAKSISWGPQDRNSVPTPMEPPVLAPLPQKPSRTKVHSLRKPTKSIADILKQTSSPLKRKATMAGLYRSSIKKPAMEEVLLIEPLKSNDMSIEVPTTPYVQESSMAPSSSPSNMLSTRCQLSFKTPGLFEFRRPLKPRATASINSILERTQIGSSTLPRRIGLPPSSAITKRSKTEVISPLLNSGSSDGPQHPTSAMKPVEVKRKRHMTVTRYRPTMEGLTGNKLEEKTPVSSSISTQGRKRKGEIEEESAEINTKKRKTTSTQKGQKLTLLRVTPSRKYIDRVTNFRDVKDAWS